MNSTHNDFDRMMNLAEFGKDQHKERRDVIFRTFIAYITLLVVSFGVILRYMNYELFESGLSGKLLETLAAVVIGVFFIVLCVFYFRWLKSVYVASMFDVRRRDFYIRKAEVISYYLSKDWAHNVDAEKTVMMNLGTNSYELTEKELFEKRKPEIEEHISEENIVEKPEAPVPKTDKQFQFHCMASVGLTVLIEVSLIIKIILIWVN